MQLQRMPDRFVLTNNEPDEDLPREVEVRNSRGEQLARYSLCEVVDSCAKGSERTCGIMVDDAPVSIAVEEENLPERFALVLENAGPCGRHGWHCPHQARSAFYTRN